VDVFSSTPYLGNPVAVVLDGRDLADEDMQRLARWTNLSETTFVLPATSADADYRLRIFTPGGELPFAGHPTLGSAHAWLEHGGTPATPGRVVQECQAGLVTLLRQEDALSFAAPPMVRTGPLDNSFPRRDRRRLWHRPPRRPGAPVGRQRSRLGGGPTARRRRRAGLGAGPFTHP
jgi:predicted PhzF superfamily epimerase YddE/YHI9